MSGLRGHFARLDGAIDAFVESLRWLGEGLGAGLPVRWRRARLSAFAAVIRPETPTERTTLYRSLFGRTELRDGGPRALDRAIILMPERLVYQTTLTLPLQALPGLNDAIALQLQRISPFPLEDLTWSSRFLGLDADRRLSVAILMARTSRVEDAFERASGQYAETAIGVSSAEDPAHIRLIARRRTARTLIARPRICAWGLAIVLVMLSAGLWTARLETAGRAAAERRDALRAELRAARDWPAERQALDGAIAELDAYASLEAALGALDETTPADLHALSSRFEYGRAVVFGLMREEEIDALDRPPANRSASGRPGFDAVTFEAALARERLE